MKAAGRGYPTHAEHDDQLRYTPNYPWIAQEELNRMPEGETHWTLIAAKEELGKLAAGGDLPTGPLLGIAEVAATLQYNHPRDPVVLDTDNSLPSGIACIESVPTLATMTRAALNILGQNEDGFYLRVEGDAVDWAAHANNTARIIEEQVDFNHAVKAVVSFVGMYSDEDQTMLLVVTDHGNAIPVGPTPATIAFEPVENRVQSVLPGVLWPGVRRS